MPKPSSGEGSKKRKEHPIDSSKASKPQAKKARPEKLPATPAPPIGGALLEPHEAAISELTPKCDVLAASIISSSHIRKRVSYVTKHLLATTEDSSSRRRLALLHSRPADVCKLITVAEQCKRVLKEEGKACYQYNQLFELPPRAKEQGPAVVEETVLENNDDDEDSTDDDDFEVMESRFEKAILPPARTHVLKSMRVFLSCTPVPELRAKKGVTLQSSEASATVTAVS